MNQGVTSWVRFGLLVLVLATALAFLKLRAREELLPVRADLNDFPRSVANWQGQTRQIPDEILKALGPGEFLLRDYVDPRERRVVNLFIAFFPTQRQGDTIHSPKNCLPGSGWAPLQSRLIWLEDATGHKVAVNRFVVAREGERAIVVYWYQAHGRTTASEFSAKYHLVADAVKMNRSDGALIRVTTPVVAVEDESAAELRAAHFAQLIMTMLDRYIPR